MTTLIFSIVFFCVGIPAVRCPEVTTYHIYRSTGSSVLFPGLELEFNDEMFHELKKIGETQEWVAQYHGGAIIHGTYTTRGQFFQNKSFLLEGLTKEDSGLYEQRVNHITLIQIYLIVSDPVPQPMLRRQEDDTESCLILLQCLHPGSDKYNITFLINGQEMNGNVSKNTNFSILFLNGTDPQHWGTYTCNVSNLIDWKVSEQLLVGSKGIPKEDVLFYILVALAVIYAVFFITLILWSIKQLNGYTILKKIIFMVRNLCGVIVEYAALFILGYNSYRFRGEWINMIGGTLIFLFIVLVRIAWCIQIKYNLRGITIAEAVLLAADFFFAPVIFIAEICFMYQDDVLCLMKMPARWNFHFYLGIAMAAMIPVVCLSRLCRKSEPAPASNQQSTQVQRKVPPGGTLGKDGAEEDNCLRRLAGTRSDEDSSITNAKSRESEEEEDGEEEDGAETVTGFMNETDEKETDSEDDK